MQLTHSPQALPGSCKGCGSGTKLPFVDTGWSEDYHGAIYYCRECVATMAELFGFITPEQAAELRANIEEFSDRCNALAAENRSLKYLQDAVDDVLNRRSHSRIASDGDFDADSAETVSVPPSPTGEVESGEGKSPESSDVKRPGNVRPTARSTAAITI